MSIDILEIAKSMMGEGIAPSLVMQTHEKLSGDFAYTLSIIDRLEEKKAKAWDGIRANTKSVAETERKWDTTDDGILHTKLKNRVKAIDKMLSSLKSKLRMLELEAQNIT